MRLIHSVVIAALLTSLSVQAALSNPGSREAREVGMMEWAQENCGYRPDPETLKGHMAVVLRHDKYGIAGYHRNQMEQISRRHGKDTACAAALEALSK